VNTGYSEVTTKVRLPKTGKVIQLATKAPAAVADGQITLRLRPFQLIALGIDTK
jgi:hypothetical protein